MVNANYMNWYYVDDQYHEIIYYFDILILVNSEIYSYFKLRIPVDPAGDHC